MHEMLIANRMSTGATPATSGTGPGALGPAGAGSPDSAERRWQERANCLGVDPDLFFPERGASTREAKGVCGGCEVRLDCLEYALCNGEKFGIWGGLSERERRRLRRQRALARRAAASA
jgi:WhiB family transcriptional regulator, redox-sensing transcriptional regulator